MKLLGRLPAPRRRLHPLAVGPFGFVVEESPILEVTLVLGGVVGVPDVGVPVLEDRHDQHLVLAVLGEHQVSTSIAGDLRVHGVHHDLGQPIPVLGPYVRTSHGSVHRSSLLRSRPTHSTRISGQLFTPPLSSWPTGSEASRAYGP